MLSCWQMCENPCSSSTNEILLPFTKRWSDNKSSISCFLTELKLCSRFRDLSRAKELHTQAISSGRLSNTYIANNFITVFAKCGSMADAQQVFDSITDPSVVSWNALLHGYSNNGESLYVLELFNAMQISNGPSPNSRTYVAAFAACAALGDRDRKNSADRYQIGKWLDKGMLLHSQAEQNHCWDLFVESALVDMYAKCGSLMQARRVFDKADGSDVVTWTCLIQGYADNGECEQALEIFQAMVERSSSSSTSAAPNARTYVAALVACATLGEIAFREDDQDCDRDRKWLETGMKIHSLAARNRCCDVFVETTLVDMYAKCGCIAKARIVFDNMLGKNLVTWNSMIQGYAENGDGDEALRLFATMADDQIQGHCVVPDARTFVAALTACIRASSSGCRADWLVKGKAIHSLAVRRCCLNSFVENALLEMYEKCGSGMNLACGVFDCVATPDVVCWNRLIRGLVSDGAFDLALEIFGEMCGGATQPNSATFVAALMAAGGLAAEECGRGFHGCINRRQLECDLVLATCLMEFYAKCGRMISARLLFDSFPPHQFQDVMAWNALVFGYSQQGDIARAFEVLKMMEDQGVAPDAMTYTHILSACSHCGLSEKAKECFDSMVKRHGVNYPQIEHYACMVDVLGRGNRLEEAVRLIEMMPFPADGVIWHSLLSSCRTWKNVELGKVAHEALLRLNHKDAGNYVSMAQIYEDQT